MSRTAAVRTAKRVASSRKCPRGSGIAMITPAASTPMIATTTISSTRVKPPSPPLLPVADIGILALAAFLVVGAVGIDVERAVLPRIYVAIGIAPGVVRQPLDIAALPIALG